MDFIIALNAVEFVVDDWFDEELPAGVVRAAASSGVHSCMFYLRMRCDSTLK